MKWCQDEVFLFLEAYSLKIIFLYLNLHIYVHDGYDKDCDPEADMLERDTILYKYNYY